MRVKIVLKVLVGISVAYFFDATKFVVITIEFLNISKWQGFVEDEMYCLVINPFFKLKYGF